jgi:pimeloyl-ACP methyl ester carboxylesterase/streptogramin lyase
VAASALVAAAVVVLDEPSSDSVTVVGQGDLVMADVPVGEAFGVRVLALGDDSLYVASENDRQLYRVDLTTHDVLTGPALEVPDAVGVADGAVFAIIDGPRLVRLDPESLERTRSVALAGEPAGLVVVDDEIWVRDVDGAASRFDAGRLEELGPIPGGLPQGFQATGGAGLWRSDPEARVVRRLDPRTGAVLATVDIDGEPRGVVVDDDGVWVADVANDRVLHVDPASGSVDRSIDVGRFPHGMALGDGRLWVSNFESGTLTTIDTDRGVVVSTVPIGVRPGGIKVDDGTLWVAVHQEGLVRAVDPDRLELRSVIPIDEAQIDADLGGRSLFLRCMGRGEPGAPTVLLEAAAGQWSEHQLFVQYGLQPTHRVCSYDRAGLGRSDPGPEPRTAQAIVDDLAEALRVADIPGPYVLVGHLQGGLYARLFAAQHAEEVSALVLVDSITPTFTDDLRPLLDAEQRAEVDAALADPELAGLARSGVEVAAAGNLGDVPLVVVSGDGGALSVVGAEAVDLWQRHQRSLLELSTDSSQVQVHDVTAALPVGAPAAIVEAVRSVAGE